MTGHRDAHDFAKAAGSGYLSIPDPGDAGLIDVDKMGICELVTAGAETRTMPDPYGPGLRVCLRMKTDGGDAVVTAANGWNVAGNTTATFADVGDQLDLISVSTATAGSYRWEIITNTGSVALA